MTPEIDKIINSIENRNHRTAFQQRFKMGAWNAAISFAYLAKRLTDIFISSAAIIALSPLMVIVAACIKLGIGGPDYIQTDKGRKKRPTFQFF